MNSYTITLFVHILAALGFFITLGLEWVSLSQARQALTTEQLRTWLRVAQGSYRVGMPSMLVLLFSGGYMMRVWGHAAWLLVAFGALVLLMLLVLTCIRPRVAAITQALAIEQSAISPSLYQQLQHPQLWLALYIRFAIALAIVFLMTVKPALPNALLSLGVASLLGLVTALVMAGRERRQQSFAA